MHADPARPSPPPGPAVTPSDPHGTLLTQVNLSINPLTGSTLLGSFTVCGALRTTWPHAFGERGLHGGAVFDLQLLTQFVV